MAKKLSKKAVKRFTSMTAFLLVSLVLAPLAFESLALALENSEIRQSIQQEMKNRHPHPNPSYWEGLGSQAIPVLKDLYLNTKNPSERAFLVDGMGYYSDPSVAEFLKAQLSDSQPILKKKLLGALVHSQGDSALEDVEPYLKDPNPHVRLTVAQAMKRYMKSSRAEDRLERFIQGEKLAWVQSSAQKPVDFVAGHGKIQMATPTPTPNPELAWQGSWKGIWVSAKEESPATLILTLVSEKKSRVDEKWKIELKFPEKANERMTGQQLKISVEAGSRLDWIEVRDPKKDVIFIGRRTR